MSGSRIEYANRWPDGEISDIRIHQDITEMRADVHRKDGFTTTPVKRNVTTVYGDWQDNT